VPDGIAGIAALQIQATIGEPIIGDVELAPGDRANHAVSHPEPKNVSNDTTEALVFGPKSPSIAPGS
jgi:hypothetical protein